MMKNILLISTFSLFILSILVDKTCYAFEQPAAYQKINISLLQADTIPPPDVMEVVKKAVFSIDNFDIDYVANLYTPNALVADDEPPYSWSGPTAGVQWVNAVEQACKDIKLTKLKGSIEAIKVFQQTADNVYLIVPVSYTGNLQGQPRFVSKGAFAFVLRMINGKWMIKSQVWLPKKSM